MADASTTLQVNIHQRQIAMLARSNTSPGGSYLNYQTGSQTLSDSQAVSLVMPVRSEPYQWPHGLMPFFDMHLPEGELRAALSNRFSKAVTGFDDFDLLSIVGPHQLGRVSVSNGSQQRGRPGAVDLQQLVHHDGTDELFADLLYQYAEYSGVSGIQPKVMVSAKTTELVPDRLTHRHATHIIKAWSPEAWPELAANEYFCLQAASLSGLKVPVTTLSDNGRLLISERFDIDTDGTYFGFEDFCSLSALPSVRKYDGICEGCVKLIRMMVSETFVPEALKTFYQMLVLSVVLGNGDAHLKNFGILYQGTSENDDAWLAPAYDIVTTRAYLPKDSMALLLGGSKRWPTTEKLVKFGRVHCQLSDQHIKQIHHRIEDAIHQTVEAMNHYARQRPAFKEMALQMNQVWLEGIKSSLR